MSRFISHIRTHASCHTFSRIELASNFLAYRIVKHVLFLTRNWFMCVTILQRFRWMVNCFLDIDIFRFRKFFKEFYFHDFYI